ncbi:MAG: biotin--[acetyl-CoA-carboxylase] ligase [Desulfovibrionaceae bacterium]
MYIYIIEKLSPINDTQNTGLHYTNDSLILHHFSLRNAHFVEQISTEHYTLNKYEIHNTQTFSMFLCSSCTSTFTVGKTLCAHHLLLPWDIILSMTQTQGRGQKGKLWDSPSGNFFGTIRLPKHSFFMKTISSLFLGATLARIIEHPPYFLAKIKWPNDIIYQNKKVAGMLILEYDEYILWGVGINLLHSPESVLPDALTATSLSQYLSTDILPSINDLSLSLIKKTKEAVSHFSKKESIDYISYIEEYLAYKGEYISVYSSPAYLAKCLGITEHGELLVQTKDTIIHSLCTETIRPHI